MHCLILTAKVLLKQQILKIHLSITSDNFIRNKNLLRQQWEKEEEEVQQYFHYKNTVQNIKSDSKVTPTLAIPHFSYTLIKHGKHHQKSKGVSVKN